MSEELTEASVQKEFNPALIRNFLILLGLAGIGWMAWNSVIQSDPRAVALLTTPQPTQASEAEDSSLGESVARQSDVTMVGSEMEIFGYPVVCGRMNNPAYPETFDASWPEALSAWSILGTIGEPGIDPGPYAVVKGDEVEVRHSLHGEEWRLDANGTLVCVE